MQPLSIGGPDLAAQALAEAQRIRDQHAGLGAGDHVVIDFADYAAQTRPFTSRDDEAGQQ